MSIEQSALGIYHMTGNQAIPQGTNWSVTMTYQTGTTPTTVDLSTYTGKLQVKQNYDSAVLLDLNTSNGGLILSSGSGSTPNVTINFLPSLTSAMNVYTDMIYDIKLVSATGNIVRFVKGQFALDRAVAN